MKKIFTRIIATVLCVVMMMGLVPSNIIDSLPGLFSTDVEAANTFTPDWPLQSGKWKIGVLDWYTYGYKPNTDHKGLDIQSAGATDWTIYSAYSGTVVVAGWTNGWGYCVRVDTTVNGTKYSMLYGHIKENSIKVKVGQSVSKGTPLGIVGHTGPADGDHLHLEIFANDQRGRQTFSYYQNNPALKKIAYLDGDLVSDTDGNRKKSQYKDWIRANCDYKNGRYYVKESYIKKISGQITPPVHSNLWLTDQRIPSGKLAYGKSFGIYGGVESEYYNITKVKTSIKNSKNQDVIIPIIENLNTTFYSFRGRVNNEIIFNDTKVFKEDYYKFIVEVWDTKDYKNSPWKKSFDFTVGNPGLNPQPNPPTYDVRPMPGGYFVYINAASGAEIRYTTNGSDPTKSSTKYNGGFAVKSTCTVKAIAVKNGIASGVNPRTITVNQVARPTIKSTLTNNDYIVEINCNTAGAKVYYTLDGTAPSPYKYYYSGPIHLTYGAKVNAYAIKDGMADSAKATPVTVKIVAPSAPDMSIPTGSDIAVGDPIEVRWTTNTENTSSNKVRVYRDKTLIKTVNVSGTRFVYIPESAGKYTFGVDAVNFVGMSSTDSTKSVTAHDPVTVMFVNRDEKTNEESLIESQSVRYGYSASVPPTPKKKGWVFKDWDSRNYLHATSDMKITAQWEREKYVVRFIDYDGRTIYSQQEVEFESPVVLPENPSMGIEGYVFSGWRVISSDTSSALDYTCVDANMTLQAVYEWGNPDMLVAIQTVSATKNDANSYEVNVTLNNGDNKTAYCRMLITLKTSGGKAVRTIVRDVTLDAKQNGVSVSDSKIICDKVATKVEVNIVRLDDQLSRTGGAFATAKTATIVDKANSYWSSWSASTPPSGTTYETKTMYRYRDKSKTDSTASSLSGWTQYGTPTITYGSWVTQNPTTSKPATSDTLQIINQSTTYTYYHYCCNYYNGKNNVDSIVYGSGKHYYHEITRSSPLPAFNMADKGGKQAYGGSGSGAPICMNNGWYAWFLKGTTTTYTYQTRSKTVTYHYYKWGNWTNWSDTKVTANSDREVQTTTYYRYKILNNVSTAGEDNTGTVYNNSNISLLGTPGVINSDYDFSGKTANVIVYKASLNDPTANYIEHVGQIKIGTGNTYNLSFQTAETPDKAESNFTVALAIEGQTSLYNIGTIYCSKSKHSVEFYADGEIIDEQQVDEGNDAVVPTPPEIPGKVFVGWNNDTTNVIASRKIEALYADETYSIVFVNFESDYVSMDQYQYGEVISIPEAGEVEGKTFLGWEGLDEDDPVAKGHAIYIAKYETGTFTVKFDDGYGNILSTQTVSYGEAAELPEAPEKEGLVFMGWSQSNQWWNVKEEMIVMPIWVYKNTVAQPNINVENLYFGGEISAETDTEGATLYYAVDDGRGEPPISIAQRELEEGNTEDSEPENDENNTEHSPLHISFLNLFTTRAFAEETDDENLAEVYSDELFDFYDWIEYDGSMVFDEDSTLYFYATADGMNDSEIVTLNYEYVPVQNPYEDHSGETFTVTFLDDDGFVLDEQTVNYFEDAVAPEVEDREGYVFTGWDNKFDHVTEDIEVTAQYVPEDEYITIALNSESINLTAGDTYALNCTVENAPEDMGDIIWSSSNETVATVSTDGLILTHQAGETVITASAGYTGYTATCKVTVLPNANETVTLNTGSKLALENGMLTEIPIVLSGRIGVAATVGEIKDQLATPGVKIVDSDGNEMDDSKPVATNTQIRIIVDDIVVDAVIVIVYGDYDGNGSVNNKDASRIMRYLVSKETPDEYQLCASDVNKDGDVNNRDAAMVSRFLVGKETL